MRVVGRSYPVNSVTIGANGRRFAFRRFRPLSYTLAKQLTVNASFIVKQRFAFRNLMPFNQLSVAVATGASLRDVSAVDLRTGVFRWQYVVVSVTISASRCVRVSMSNRFAVNTVSVGFENGNFEARRFWQLLFQVTLPAPNLLSVARVRQLSWVNIVVAVSATKFAVNRPTKNFLVNKNASLPSTNIKTVNVRVAVTLLTNLDFLFGSQDGFRFLNSNPLRPNEGEKPEKRQNGGHSHLTHSLHSAPPNFKHLLGQLVNSNWAKFAHRSLSDSSSDDLR